MFSTSDVSRFRPYMKILVPAAIALLAMAAGAQAPHGKKQAPYALLFGTIWGPNQHPLPGVEIHIRRSIDKKARWDLISNSTGEFAQRVPVGKMDYVVWTDIKEKKKPTRHVETNVHVENDERVDFGLHLTE